MFKLKSLKGQQLPLNGQTALLGFFTPPTNMIRVFSSPEHEVLRVSYCDHSPSVRPSSVHISLFTL